MDVTKRKVKMDFVIKPYNIDAAGHVNNAVFINWFEDLRLQLFEDNFNFEKLFDNNMYPVVISTDIVYKKFLKLFDKPAGTMYIEYCNHGIFTLKTEIIVANRLAAYGTQRCIMYDLQSSKILKDFHLKEIDPAAE